MLSCFALPCLSFTLLLHPPITQGRHVQYRVTAVTGHVFSIDFPPEYSNWDAVDPKDLFYA